MPAHASSGMGLKGLGELVALLIGIAALALSAVLGAASWATVLRPPTTVGWIFGRGFLGVSAVIAFLIGGLGIAMGLEEWIGSTPWIVITLATMTTLFMAIEFFIAGTLYRRAYAHRASLGARALSITSYVLGTLFSIATCLLVVTGIVVALADA